MPAAFLTASLLATAAPCPALQHEPAPRIVVAAVSAKSGAVAAEQLDSLHRQLRKHLDVKI